MTTATTLANTLAAIDAATVRLVYVLRHSRHATPQQIRVWRLWLLKLRYDRAQLARFDEDAAAAIGLALATPGADPLATAHQRTQSGARPTAPAHRAAVEGARR
jgi:hypothetical protein